MSLRSRIAAARFGTDGRKARAEIVRLRAKVDRLTAGVDAAQDEVLELHAALRKVLSGTAKALGCEEDFEVILGAAARLSAEAKENHSLFLAAIRDLAAINAHLDLDPDDGGAAPIIDAINVHRARVAELEKYGKAAWATADRHLTERQQAQAQLQDAFAPTSPSADEAEALRADADPNGQSIAAKDVLAERRRQVEEEGWTPEHDDEHSPGDLAKAGGYYAINAGVVMFYRATNTTICNTPPDGWPWSPHWWNPSSARRDLVKSAALIIAEIDRIDRADKTTAAPTGPAAVTEGGAA